MAAIGNTGGIAPSEGFRQMAVAKAASVGRGGFGPEPGRQGGQKELQGRVEARNRAEKREARQDRIEAARRLAPAYQAGQGRYSHVQNPRNPTIQT